MLDPQPDIPAALVTIGAGHAAVSTVRTLRRRGFDGRIVVLSDELHAPYQRPPLSKEYLRGDADLDDVSLLDPDWCAAHDVDLRLGSRAAVIDTSSRCVRLTDGSTVAAENVLVATGARARRLTGVEGERVVHLRGLDDADRLRDLLTRVGRIVTIGGGLIGSEVASTARDAGIEVVCLEAEPLPMLAQLGPEIARVYADLHREQGVDLRCGLEVRTVSATGTGVRVHTRGGDCVEADAVVVAVGAVADDTLGVASGLSTDLARGGILVDPEGRTSVEGVFAAGDVASRLDTLTGRHTRAEHVDAAQSQGAAVARAILGMPSAAPTPPWFWSDQYDRSLQFVGRPRADATVVVRGEIEARDFTAFYLADGRVHAAFSVDRGGDVPAARQLVALGTPVSEATLADEDLDLLDLVDSATGVVHAR